MSQTLIAPEKLRSPSYSQMVDRWIWLVYLTPFFITALFIAKFGVNVPFQDEWGIPYIFRMIRQGHHGFADLFWAPNNEHRMVVPKLIWTAVAYLSNFNVKLNMFVSLALVLLTYVG